jgi:hypothetical protein
MLRIDDTASLPQSIAIIEKYNLYNHHRNEIAAKKQKLQEAKEFSTFDYRPLFSIVISLETSVISSQLIIAGTTR